MSKAPPYDFEPAPDLPGPDRLAKYVSTMLRFLTHHLWTFEIEGSQNIPAVGPAIVTPNHLSFCDSIFLPSALPRRAWGIGKGEYMDSWKTKYILPAMGMIPIDRSGGRAAEATLDTAADVLEGGHLFIIYPEGTRSRTGHLYKGRTGAARLAIRCDVPIVPVGHRGTVEVQPPGSVVIKLFKVVTARFGVPMWARDHGDPDDPRTPRRFTDAVMFEISQLSGQTYVDEYAGKKAGTTAAPTDGVDEDDSVLPGRPSVVGDSPARIPSPVARRIVAPPPLRGTPSDALTVAAR